MATQLNPTIKQMTIDLSGKGGLADKWAGELISPTQTNSQTNYTTKDGEMMFGNFNPIKRKGYMSPIGSTFVTVNPQTSFTVLMAASQVDEVNEDVYFFENGTKIMKADSFDDLTLTDDRTISGATGVDLAIYELYGTRMLYYSYHNTTRSIMGVKDTATVAPTFTVDAATDIITFSGDVTTWQLWENRPMYLLHLELSSWSFYFSRLLFKRCKWKNSTSFNNSWGCSSEYYRYRNRNTSVSLFLDDFSDEIAVGVVTNAFIKVR